MTIVEFCRGRQVFSPESILQIYKSTIRRSIEYSCDIWFSLPVMYLYILDKFERRICNDVGPDHRINVAFQRYFYK